MSRNFLYYKRELKATAYPRHERLWNVLLNTNSLTSCINLITVGCLIYFSNLDIFQICFQKLVINFCCGLNIGELYIDLFSLVLLLMLFKSGRLNLVPLPKLQFFGLGGTPGVPPPPVEEKSNVPQAINLP